MSKSKLTNILEQEIWRTTRKQGVFGCFEVTIGWNGKERVDYMTYDTKGLFRCYEIKSSISDFKSACAISFVGHYNYYVLTDKLYERVKANISSDIGIYVYNTTIKNCVLVQKAKKRTIIDEQILKDSLIRSLSREAAKVYNENDEFKQIKLEREKNNYLKEIGKLKHSFNSLLLYIYRKFGNDWQSEFLEHDQRITVKQLKLEIKKTELSFINNIREIKRKKREEIITNESYFELMDNLISLFKH